VIRTVCQRLSPRGIFVLHPPATAITAEQSTAANTLFLVAFMDTFPFVLSLRIVSFNHYLDKIYH
jgi:hypothetical protein